MGVDSNTSGWSILARLVLPPVFAFFFLYGVLRAALWATERGADYRAGHQDFLGVPGMVGMNLGLPGTGLMAGGFAAQGWACLALWALVLLTGMRYDAPVMRNLVVVHLFAGVWASVIAGREASQRSERETQQRRARLQKVNLDKQRIPTMEDPDLYVIRLQVFQTLLEAGADATGRFDSIQKASVNKLRTLLRIEPHTYGKLLTQLQTYGDAKKTLGDGAALGATATFEKLIPQAVDHPAFEGVREGLLQGAATLLGIPAPEAKARREAYESGREYTGEGSLSADLSSASFADSASASESQEVSDDPAEDRTEFGYDDPTTI